MRILGSHNFIFLRLEEEFMQSFFYKNFEAYVDIFIIECYL